MNRIKIQVILLILQLETDYFSKLFISEIHSKQWHYSLHRDFQNCYSTRRSPTGFFSSNSTRVPICHPHLHVHSTSREFSIQNPILHTEDKELFEYYYWCESRIQKGNSMHRRQGDLLEIHPCVLQDLPKTFQSFQTFQTFQSFQSFQTFRTFQSFMTFQPFQAILQILQCSSVSRESTPFQHSPIRMHILQFDWFPQKLHRVPVEQLQTTNIHSSKKGRCCDIGQN